MQDTRRPSCSWWAFFLYIIFLGRNMHVLKDFTLAPDKVVGGMEKVKWGQRRVCKEKTFAALIVTGGSPESQCLRDAAWLLVSRGRLELTYGADIQSGTWQPSQLTLGCEQADRSVSVRSPARGSSLQNLSEPFSRHSCLRIPAASAWPVQGEPHEVWVECSAVGRTERLTTRPHTHTPLQAPVTSLLPFLVSVACGFVCVLRFCLRACAFGVQRGTRRVWRLPGTQDRLMSLPFPGWTVQTDGSLSSPAGMRIPKGKDHSQPHRLPWDTQGKLD